MSLPPTGFCLNFLNNSTSNTTAYLSTNGSTILQTIGSANPPINWTIEAWIKVPAAGYNAAGGIAGSNNSGFSIYLSGTNPPYLQAGIPQGAVHETLVPLNDNAWHYVAATVDANKNGTYYIDGIQKNTFTQTANGSYTTPWLIGGRTVGGTSDNFIGSIAEVRVWNSALPSSVISQIWNKSIPCSINQNGTGGLMESYSLVAYYSNFNQYQVSNGILSCLATGPRLFGSGASTSNNVNISPISGNFSDTLCYINSLNFLNNTVGSYESYFTNSSSAGTVFAISDGTSWTIEGWVQIPASGSNGGNMGFVGSNNSRFALAFQNYYLIVQDNDRETTTPLNDGIWHYIAVTAVPGGQLNYYIDGVQKTSKTYSGISTASITNEWVIGARDTNPSNSQNFIGKMTEIRVWARAFTASEIGNQWKGQVLTNSSGLIAYYSNFPMNQTISNGTKLVSITPVYTSGGLPGATYPGTTLSAYISGPNNITMFNPSTIRNTGLTTNYQIAGSDLNTYFDGTISIVQKTGYNLNGINDIGNIFTPSSLLGSNASVVLTSKYYNNGVDIGTYFNSTCPIPPPIKNYTFATSIFGGGLYWKITDSKYNLFSIPPNNNGNPYGYEVIQFLTSGSITFPFDYACQVCIVGGGGGSSSTGGGYQTGGGGGGAVATGSITFGGGVTYTLTVGSSGGTTSITSSTTNEIAYSGGGGGDYSNPVGGSSGTYSVSSLTGHGGYNAPLPSTAPGFSTGCGAGGSSGTNYGGMGYLWPITNNYYGGGGGAGNGDGGPTITGVNSSLTYINSGGWGGGGYGICRMNVSNSAVVTYGAGNAVDGYGGGGGGSYGRVGPGFPGDNSFTLPNASVPGGSGGIYIAIPNDPTFTNYWYSAPTFHYMFNNFVNPAWPSYTDYYISGSFSYIKNCVSSTYVSNPNGPGTLGVGDGKSETLNIGALTQSTNIIKNKYLNAFNMGRTTSVVTPNILINSANYVFRGANSGFTVCFYVNINSRYTAALEIFNLTSTLGTIRIMKGGSGSPQTPGTAGFSIYLEGTAGNAEIFSTSYFTDTWLHIAVICSQGSPGTTTVIVNGGTTYSPSVSYSATFNGSASGINFNTFTTGTIIATNFKLGSTVDANFADFRFYEAVLSENVIYKFIANVSNTPYGVSMFGNYGDGWLSNNQFQRAL